MHYFLEGTSHGWRNFCHNIKYEPFVKFLYSQGEFYFYTVYSVCCTSTLVVSMVVIQYCLIYLYCVFFITELHVTHIVVWGHRDLQIANG